MTKNPFKQKRTYFWGFILSAIFVFLIITNIITNYATDKILDKFESGCSVTFADRPINRERCIQKSNEARTFSILNKEICGGCGTNQLCLESDDLDYCLAGFEKNQYLINIRTQIKTVTGWIDELSGITNLLIVMGLFVVGFFGRWIIRGK